MVLLLRGLVALAALAVALPAYAQEEQAKPNIILMIMDDVGYSDLSAYGNTLVKMPHTKELASEGLLLTRFYSSHPVCTPTRAGIYTGVYPERFGVSVVPPGNVKDYGIPEGYDTLPRTLAKAGYYSAIIGKWHVGLDKPYRPQEAGFNECRMQRYVEGCNRSQSARLPQPVKRDYFERLAYYLRTRMEVFQSRFSAINSHALAAEVANFLEQREQEPEPFFLVVGFNAAHDPYPALEEYKKLYPEQPDDTVRKWYAEHTKFPMEQFDKNWPRERNRLSVLSALDDSIGFIMRQLKKRGMDDNTLVMVMSDNGCAGAAGNGKLRGGKFNIYEGGIRVPALVRWPGHVATGKSAVLMSSLDILPSFATFAGLKPDDLPKTLDGYDMSAMLTATQHIQEGTPRAEVSANAPEGDRAPRFWYWMRQYAVQQGGWKLIHIPEDARYELYQVAMDTQENNNLVNRNLPQEALLKAEVAKFEALLAPYRPKFEDRFSKEMYSQDLKYKDVYDVQEEHEGKANEDGK